MKKMLFVIPLLAVFSLATMPVASAASIDDVYNAVLDPYVAVTGHTAGSLARQILDELRLYVEDPATGSALTGGRSIGWLARQAYNEAFDAQRTALRNESAIAELKDDVAQLQASVDEVIALLKTPQGRRADWNQ